MSRVISIYRNSGAPLAALRIFHSVVRRLVGRMIYGSLKPKWRPATGLRVLGYLFVENPHNVIIGNNCILSHGVSLVSEIDAGTLRLGNNVQLNEYVSIDYSGGVVVEDGVLISRGTTIYSHSHGYDPRSLPVGIPKTIGKNTWIGANAIITEKVRSVGENSIIAAGSVVTRDVPPNVIVAGNPAKTIRIFDQSSQLNPQHVDL